MELSGAPAASVDRRQPLNPNGSVASTPKTTSLNDRLDTSYVDVGPNEDSVKASVTKTITGFVGNFVSPRRLLVYLRILKAITFCFLVLTLAANLMYIAFLEVFASKEVRDVVGGRRDMVIRIYGLFLTGMAIIIELDITPYIKQFYGFKGFIPRALLLFFIAAITGAHPVHATQVEEKEYDDAYYDDDAAVDDVVGYEVTTLEIPNSAVYFQMVTSFVL